LLITSLIEDDTLCNAACVVGTFAIWFRTAAADTWEDDDDDDDDIEDEDMDEEVAERTVDVGIGGLFGGVCILGPSKLELCLFVALLEETGDGCAGRVRTDLAAESERGFPEWTQFETNLALRSGF